MRFARFVLAAQALAMVGFSLAYWFWPYEMANLNGVLLMESASLLLVLETLQGRPLMGSALKCCVSGDVLVSHTVPRAVPSALKGLTSGFGMGPGVSLTQ